SYEDGTFAYPAKQPGGGNPGFRKQMKALAQFINSFEFIKMRPDKTVIKSGLPEKAHARVLAEPGHQHASYLIGGEQATLALQIPAGQYHVECIVPISGAITKSEDLTHEAGDLKLSKPAYVQEIALKLMKQ